MIYLEGRQIAEEIKKNLTLRVGVMPSKPRLAIVMVGDNAVSAAFVGLKEKFASSIGVETRRYEFPGDISTNTLRERMSDIVHESHNNGVIVQLPLPQHIDVQSILSAVTPDKDVDALSARSVGDFQVGKHKVMPPVAGAVELLFKHYGIDITAKHIAIIGYGRLVGQPLAVWCLRGGGLVTVISNIDHLDESVVRSADIIMSGVGKPHYLSAHHIKEGVVVVDVGTSEMKGEIVGDAHPDVKTKAAFMTPSKGGIGPLTVALVFRNLLDLAERNT